jgi:hypothetical protein
MSAPRKYDRELRKRAVRMHRERPRAVSPPATSNQDGAKSHRHSGANLG